jgi:hypothetical protein
MTLYGRFLVGYRRILVDYERKRHDYERFFVDYARKHHFYERFTKTVLSKCLPKFSAQEFIRKIQVSVSQCAPFDPIRRYLR